jgi:hypothetical protein
MIRLIFAESIIVAMPKVKSSVGRSNPKNAHLSMPWGVLSDLRVGSESLIGKPSENDVNLSSISQGSVGSEMNYFLKLPIQLK